MRQGVRAIIASFVAGVVLAPAAAAATPQQIYRDLADNGRLDGAYTQAEMKAFLKSASVQGYGNPVVVTVPPGVKPASSGVAGASKTQGTAQPAAAVAGVQTPLAETATVDTLPFTGSELALFAFVGGALLLGGLLLRASARRR